jgi:hypothetical protein
MLKINEPAPQDDSFTNEEFMGLPPGSVFAWEDGDHAYVIDRSQHILKEELQGKGLWTVDLGSGRLGFFTEKPEDFALLEATLSSVVIRT